MLRRPFGSGELLDGANRSCRSRSEPVETRQPSNVFVFSKACVVATTESVPQGLTCHPRRGRNDRVGAPRPDLSPPIVRDIARLDPQYSAQARRLFRRAGGTTAAEPWCRGRAMVPCSTCCRACHRRELRELHCRRSLRGLRLACGNLLAARLRRLRCHRRNLLAARLRCLRLRLRVQPSLRTVTREITITAGLRRSSPSNWHR